MDESELIDGIIIQEANDDVVAGIIINKADDELAFPPGPTAS